MNAALYISKTGLAAQDVKLATISNNLANASTIGFKRDHVNFEDLLYQIQRQPGGQSSQDTQLPSGLQVGTGVRVVGTQKQFGGGSLQVTDQGLDMAVVIYFSLISLFQKTRAILLLVLTVLLAQIFWALLTRNN
jgi:flagellar basal-body rod protein FlgG